MWWTVSFFLRYIVWTCIWRTQILFFIYLSTKFLELSHIFLSSCKLNLIPFVFQFFPSKIMKFNKERYKLLVFLLKKSLNKTLNFLGLLFLLILTFCLFFLLSFLYFCIVSVDIFVFLRHWNFHFFCSYFWCFWWSNDIYFKGS